MGIDYSGGMIVGCSGGDITLPDDYEEFYEWVEENDLDSYSEFYDAPSDYTYYGYGIADVAIDALNEEWIKEIKEIKELGEKFEKLSGEKAFLIGTQNIY